MLSTHEQPPQEAITFEAQLEHELEAVEWARYCLKAERAPAAGWDLELPKDPAAGGDQGPVKGAVDRAHDNNLLGLALSGGGIRSATFNLGVIQRLAALRLLHRIDYLSTVSGGGYIGGWLSSWVSRQKGDRANGIRAGVLGVEDRLREGGARGQDPARSPEPRQVRWLREFSNYLTPRVGTLSTDTLTGVATYLRNLLLNQVILVAFGASLLVLPWFLAAFLAELGDGWIKLGPWVAALLLFVGSSLAGYETLRADLGRRAEHPSPAADAKAQRLYWVLFASFSAAAVVAGLSVTRRPELLEWRWLLLAGAYGFGTSGGWWTAAYQLKKRAPEIDPGKLWLFRPIWALVAGAGLGGMVWLWAWFVGGSAAPLASPLPAVTLGPLVMLGAILFAVTLHLGLAGRSLREAGRELWSSHGAHQMRFGVGWLVLAGSSLFGPLVLLLVQNWVAALGGITWVLTTIMGVLAGSGASTGSGGKKVSEVVARIAPYVFVLGVLLALSYGVHHAIWWQWSATESPSRDIVCEAAPRQPVYQVDIKSEGGVATGELYDAAPATYRCLEGYVDKSASVVTGRAGELLLVAFGLIAFAILLSWRVDVNVFGFNMFYRNRIERCYMGASNLGRRPHPLTGLDPTDAPRLRDLVQGVGGDAEPGTPLLAQRPFPIVNAAMNITSSRNLAWQERKAASFSFTPMYCGYEIQDPDGRVVSGYQRTNDYVRNEGKWISLGLPISVSGAAASPNEGYHSSAATAFLMTVFNVRLGWWLQNPRYAQRWQRPGPRFSLFLLLQELAGMTNDESRYVYLSDGGHFENLGIYELVRRRCRYIIACDAGCDPKYGFEDLGNVIRKCQIDLGIGIDIDPRGIRPNAQSGHSEAHCAVGRIHYEQVDKNARPGFLFYVKASLTGGEPTDILQYALAHAAFPHEATADQWYSESQFESYRKLGFHAIDSALADAIGEHAAPTSEWEADLEDVFTALSERWYPTSPQVRASFSEHGRAVEAIFERIRKEQDLRFLDGQIYPEWWHLTEAAQVGTPGSAPTPTMLPKHVWEVRAGFYLCNSLLQIMENVYHDLNLEEQFAHPDNRGWMNLFRHWSWAGMLRVTWAISASMYGARFQRFCRRRLDLAVGQVSCGEPVRLADMDERGGLNFLEADHVRKIVGACWPRRKRSLSVVQLSLQVINPFGEGDRTELAFPFAFALVDASGGKRRLVYFRVRDHLRGIGLGRKALAVLLADKRVKDIVALDHEEQDRISTVIGEADYSALHRLWSSVTAAAQERGSGDIDRFV
jgi:hypothetical protein